MRTSRTTRMSVRCFGAVALGCIPACAGLNDPVPVHLPAPQLVARQDALPLPNSAAETDSGSVKMAKAEFKLPTTPDAQAQGTPLPITLASALMLTGANALDIQIADERVRTAAAQLERAKVLWLPNLNFGADYFRHDGQLQDIVGRVFGTNKSSLLIGAGPQAVISTADAVFAPLVRRPGES